MSKVLVITAHPKTKQFSNSLTLAKHFLTAYRQANPADTIIQKDLSSQVGFPFNEVALSIYQKSRSKQPLTAEKKTFATGRQAWLDEFVTSDKYVFVNPMFNYFIPAEMKSYIDVLMQVPITFHYLSDGTPEGLLHGKKALHLQSAGGFYANEPGHPDLRQMNMGNAYLKMNLAIMGVTDYQSLFVEGMDNEPENTPKLQQAAFAKADQLGSTF
ncbi:FMN-dependent NADH-azoreductase [Pediococcus damnosus LMG 28219]|uniref:FMN-dependent NADH-azoreductase n=1 Tax=Pediococcus damnosus TaxID=51663 RepID=UPI00061F39A6|nr:NAD(P)H-dependent oxidoreductase [Pediococcus damnosus]KJU74711.1 FMN-dependent NADH-azoreductase [Pediococcus damnosus LMG 28219]